jgi:hypothetical protein
VASQVVLSSIELVSYGHDYIEQYNSPLYMMFHMRFNPFKVLQSNVLKGQEIVKGK